MSSASSLHSEPEHVDHVEGTSKVKFVLGMLKKLVGVKDLSSMRISLPASLLEPESNLEFWNYMDRPDYFVAIPDGTDSLERMLRVIRWWYAKDTKWKDQRIRKPYNSVLGERFLCWWEVPNDQSGGMDLTRSSSDTGGVGSSAASEVASTMTSSTAAAVDAERASLADDQRSGHQTLNGGPSPTLQVTCVTEQICHHPPVSAYYYACPEKGIIGRGVDHVSARFTGTTIKVGPGAQNHGIYITLTSHDDEEYNIQHPWASVTGWLSGSPYVVVGESAVITCPKSGLKAVLEYKDEPMFGKPKFAVEGKIFRYDYEMDKSLTEKERKEREKLSKIKDSDVVARIYGQWNGQVYCVATPATESYLAAIPPSPNVSSSSSLASHSSRASTTSSSSSASLSSTPRLLFDMVASHPAVKLTAPIAKQHPYESRRIWEPVTTALLAKDYTAATNAKRVIEDAQRKLAVERAEKGEGPYESFYFEFEGDRAGKPGPPADMTRAKPLLKAGRNWTVPTTTTNKLDMSN